MRKRGKVKIVLTVFIIVLFSCTAVIGNSRTGVIENVMAKNAADVDILTIKSRVFTGEEIIKAWLDTDTLDENCLTVLAQRGTAAVTTTYDTGKQKITVNWNQGAFNGAIVRINGREEKTREEWTARWLKTFENLGISVDDSYEKKWQGENNDEEHDIYYIEENGIHLCPNGYSLGDLGQCWGQSIDITIEKDGYFVSFNNVSEVIAREEKKGRKLISKEKAIRACLDNYFWDQNAEDEVGVLVEEASCDMEYLMIDKGSENDESVCDIGYYVQIPMSDTDGGNQYVIEGFVDGEYPYCYATAMTANVNQTDQSEWERRDAYDQTGSKADCDVSASMVLCRDLRGSFVDGNCRDVKNKRGNIGSGLVRFVVCVRRIWHYNFGEKSGISYECCIGIF